jgi:hypothetical protein
MSKVLPTTIHAFLPGYTLLFAVILSAFPASVYLMLNKSFVKVFTTLLGIKEIHYKK